MQTRWHVDDMAGRLLKDTSGKWKVLSFPAIAEKDDEYRKAGEALHPERYPVPFFDAIKTDPNFSRKDFDALFQQKPRIAGGNIIHGSDFKFYEVLPPQLSFRFMTCDTAQKTKEANDFSVFACWGVANNRLYLIDMIRGKWEAPALKVRVVAFWNKHKERHAELGVLRKMYVEDKSSGTGLIQEIKAEATMPIEAIQRNTDKYSRVSDVLGRIESGYVFLPKGAPFISDFLGECEAFTANDSHSHDDVVDVLVDGIEKGIPIAKRDWDAIAKGMNQ
jgi:predicted phage terminase large subunit-like protein